MRIQKYPDLLPNSPDACGRKPYPERKICGFKNIRIRVDGALVAEGPLKATLSTACHKQIRGSVSEESVVLRQWENGNEYLVL